MIINLVALVLVFLFREESGIFMCFFYMEEKPKNLFAKDIFIDIL